MSILIAKSSISKANIYIRISICGCKLLFITYINTNEWGDVMSYKLFVKNLSYTYYSLKGEIPVLKDISFNVSPGEFIAIIGPSGCGKTTLLNCLIGLNRVTEGDIMLDGLPQNAATTKIGIMHQRDLLFGWRTLDNNAKLPLEITGEKSDTGIISKMLEKYDLSGFENSYPRELSGGMRQRAALIRTMISNPDILLLDEPFSALDFQTRLEVADYIYKIIKTENKTAILITHDIEEAISMADRIIILSKRPARVINEYKIQFRLDNRTPYNTRLSEEFPVYLNEIYEELRHEN